MQRDLDTSIYEHFLTELLHEFFKSNRPIKKIDIFIDKNNMLSETPRHMHINFDLSNLIHIQDLINATLKNIIEKNDVKMLQYNVLIEYDYRYDYERGFYSTVPKYFIVTFSHGASRC